MPILYITKNIQEELSFSSLSFPIRLDVLLRSLLNNKGFSREKIKYYIQKQHVLVNGTVCTTASKKIHEHDDIRIHIPEESSMLCEEEGDIDIMYEDEDLLLINKPHSLVVHPCTSTPTGTLLQRLLFHYPELADMGGERPAIVHRLDKDTTGLLIVARTEKARYGLVQAFSERTIEKYYVALVEGKTPAKGIIESPIGRDTKNKTKMACSPKGKYAYTEYKTLCTVASNRYPSAVSLLSIRIATGRTHQIRVHLASIGHPIIGDTLYGAKQCSFISRPLLHAFRIIFEHPIQKRSMEYMKMPPKDFEDAFIACATQSTKVILTGCAGSGKSTVLQYFIQEGIPCCSTDNIVESLYCKENSLWHYCRQSYGTRFLNQDDTINKHALLLAMKESPQIKKEIERVTHSFVAHAVHEFWKNHIHAPYTIVEVPLYFESEDFRKNCPAGTIIAVISKEEERKKRMHSKGWDKEKIEYVVKNQYDDTYKKEHADYIIENNSTLEDLHKNCKKVKEYIYTYQNTKEQHYREYYTTLLMKEK